MLPPTLAHLRLVAFVLSATQLLAQSYVSGLVYERKSAGFVPIAGAVVEARLATDRSADEGDGAQAQTDTMGRYMLRDLPSGELLLTASHPRHYPVGEAEPRGEKRVRCSGVGSCGKVDFEMLPNGNLEVAVTSLEVTVTNSIGDPLDEVRVTVRDLAEPARRLGWAFKQRRGNGVFFTSEMRPGRYLVEAEPTKPRRRGTYHRVATEVEFRYGQKSESVRLIMPFTRHYRVSGMIVGLERSQASRLMVVLEPEEAGPEDPEAEVKRLGAPLEENGRFVINGVARGAYSVNLIPIDDTVLYQNGGPQYLLGKIRVDDDVPGLLFSAPAGVSP